ncbi:unnamed protein product [Sphagnum jensenii]|uniref:Uncharacterized protein n=2 Tax=Sphagnum jensenii TaxID=128206 RepID=A0ABP0VUB1_9BRYO
MGGSHYRRVPSRADFPRGLWEGRPVELQREPRGSRSSRGASGRSRGVPAGMVLTLSERERPWLPSATLTSPPGSRICARVREDPLHHTRDLGLLGLLASCC